MAKNRWNWKSVSLPEDLLEKQSGRFERGVYEVARELEPENLEVLVALGNLYTQQGLIEKGLEVDLKLVRMRPSENIFHYNLACSHSLLGQLDPAFAALKRAIQLGYDDFEHLQRDTDLVNLQQDRRFEDIVRQLQERHFKA